MRTYGKGPVMLRSGRFAIRVARAPEAPPLSAWALALDGTRRGRIALASDVRGLSLDLDTAVTPTPFVELATE